MKKRIFAIPKTLMGLLQVLNFETLNNCNVINFWSREEIPQKSDVEGFIFNLQNL